MAPAQRHSTKREPAERSSADAREIEKFSALSAEWWNTDGAFAALHRLNPLRLAFIRRVAAQHFRKDARRLSAFADLSLVDIGCGGGLLCEPLARQGFRVLGIDAAQESVAAAAAHQGDSRESLAYRCADAEDLVRERLRFDVVLAMEIVEHVADRPGFLEICATLVKPGGLFFVATIARTVKALALAKIGAEYLLRWIPPGTHDWNKFVSPGTLSAEIERTGLSVLEIQGVSFDPLDWRWRLSTDTDVNYMLAAAKPRRRARTGEANSRR
ncbi:MAG TPA: bifunctional 2-polyprenyl-6-hydroxyphenol methylase/3-demethylubiquinol 3-O-methyltransferase UbiG [Rhizomicrobium sp.]|nr:bifunctional 2-polyprenyl-6-hydroxyphenol methylase/3-demethylubiquinol 3-O-methyltransferase UbiG [Rhizomicrobium sp.]